MLKYSLMPKDSDHHSWSSRDYQQIDCQAIGCMYNVLRQCAVPSLCVINENGGCNGFKAKKDSTERTGD